MYFSLFTITTFSVSSSPARPRKKSATSAHWGTILPFATDAVMCTTALPSVAAFTRPASNIVANFIFTNARAIPRSSCKYSR